MLSYLDYINESTFKLVREKTGKFKILNLKFEDTGMYLDQNLKYGKKWDLIINEKSVGEFKTKHEALIFLETE